MKYGVVVGKRAWLPGIGRGCWKYGVVGGMMGEGPPMRKWTQGIEDTLSMRVHGVGELAGSK